MRNVFQYFARTGGRGEKGGELSCSDPPKEDGETYCPPRGKAELLWWLCANKLAATAAKKKIAIESLRGTIRKMAPGGTLQLVPKIIERGIELAKSDIPKKKVAGPDLFPAGPGTNCL